MNNDIEQGKLLIVEDNFETRTVIYQIFKKYYQIEQCESAVSALEKIKSGYRPHVILSEQRIPYMSGSEFLEKTITLIPEAIRVIITAHTSPSEIIQAVNQSKAYMYLIKPLDNLQLVQAVKNCFAAYKANLEKNNLLIELQKRNEVIISILRDMPGQE